jgi:hypothetical protein
LIGFKAVVTIPVFVGYWITIIIIRQQQEQEPNLKKIKGQRPEFPIKGSSAGLYKTSGK